MGPQYDEFALVFLKPAFIDTVNSENEMTFQIGGDYSIVTANESESMAGVKTRYLTVFMEGNYFHTDLMVSGNLGLTDDCDLRRSFKINNLEKEYLDGMPGVQVHVLRSDNTSVLNFGKYWMGSAYVVEKKE